jgi:hypothetical protein
MPFPCHYPAILRQCCVLRETSLSCAWSSPAISFQELTFTKLLSQFLCCKLHKHSCPCTNTIILPPSITNAALFHTGHCIWDCYAADNNLSGTGRGSRNKPNAGRSPTCRLLPSPCRNPATTLPWHWGVAFKKAYSWHGIGTAWERHGMCESNTAALCTPNGKDTI